MFFPVLVKTLYFGGIINQNIARIAKRWPENITLVVKFVKLLFPKVLKVNKNTLVTAVTVVTVITKIMQPLRKKSCNLSKNLFLNFVSSFGKRNFTHLTTNVMFSGKRFAILAIFFKHEWFCVRRGIMVFVCGEVLRFFSLTHSSCMIYFSGGCIIFFCREIARFFFDRLHVFLWRGCMIFLRRGCIIFCSGQVLWFFCCWEVAWFFFVWRCCVIYVCGEVVWFFSLTNSGCMIYFSGGCMICFAKRLHDFFIERLCDFFVSRGCVIFCLNRLRDFLYQDVF